MSKKKKTTAKSKNDVKKAENRKVYIHIDEYLSHKKDLEPNIKFAFKAFLKNRIYKHSMEDFDEELERFYNRKI